MEIGKKGVVLVVDDVESEIDILVDILHQDYEVCVAMDGENALETAAEVHPDLILLDVLMPGLDGYEVCRRLKQDPRTKDSHVIFVTVLSEEGHEATGLALGALDFITKPFNREIVRARVRNHMELIEAHRLKQDVNRIISHDMRNELTVILGYPEILLESPNLNKEEKRMVGLIRQSGYTLLNLVNLDLQLYKMERGLYSFSPEPVDALQVLYNIIEHIRETSKLHPVAFSIRKDDRPCWPDDTFIIRSEELLLHSMLFNLLVNAVEASPEYATVTIKLEQNCSDHTILIHNRGAIPLKIRDRFFGKYVTSGKETGTGLGAYSAMLMAKAHGGSIDMTTSEAMGTTVSVRLPS